MDELVAQVWTARGGSARKARLTAFMQPGRINWRRTEQRAFSFSENVLPLDIVEQSSLYSLQVLRFHCPESLDERSHACPEKAFRRQESPRAETGEIATAETTCKVVHQHLGFLH